MEYEEFRLAVVIVIGFSIRNKILQSITIKMASNVRMLLFKNDTSLVSLTCSTVL
jgi:hypothetical protein